MKDAVDLEQAFHDAVVKFCGDEDDRDAAKDYFQNTTISDMIDEALDTGVHARDRKE